MTIKVGKGMWLRCQLHLPYPISCVVPLFCHCCCLFIVPALQNSKACPLAKDKVQRQRKEATASAGRENATGQELSKTTAAGPRPPTPDAWANCIPEGRRNLLL